MATDHESLPDLSTWYLVTNLPAPTERLGPEPPFPPASLEEVIRLYGLRSKMGSTLGGITFAYLSTGEQIDNPRFIREEEHALARAQRTFSKEQKRTPEWERRRKVVARVHEGVRWRREVFIRQKLAYTSQTCSACGHRQAMPLSVRVYQCATSGLVMDRDYNGSKNILAEALEAVGRHGCVIPEAPVCSLESRRA